MRGDVTRRGVKKLSVRNFDPLWLLPYEWLSSPAYSPEPARQQHQWQFSPEAHLSPQIFSEPARLENPKPPDLQTAGPSPKRSNH